MLLLYILISFFALYSDAHGHVITPTTRGGFRSKQKVGTSKPVGFEVGEALDGANELEDVVCRFNSPGSQTRLQWTAGNTIEIKYFWAIPHPGFCDMMMSYDADSTDRRTMKWFKIGNIINCGITPGGILTTSTFRVQLPNWLKSGNAVFRFNWMAMHNHPPEFYVDCIDVTITGPNNDSPNFVNAYPILSPTLYNKYAIEWADGYAETGNDLIPIDFVTGPACAEVSAYYNECFRSKPGTPGYFDPLAATGTPAPTKRLVTPAPTKRLVTPAPTKLLVTSAPTRRLATPAPTRRLATPPPTRNLVREVVTPVPIKSNVGEEESKTSAFVLSIIFLLCLML